MKKRAGPEEELDPLKIYGRSLKVFDEEKHFSEPIIDEAGPIFYGCKCLKFLTPGLKDSPRQRDSRQDPVLPILAIVYK